MSECIECDDYAPTQVGPPGNPGVPGTPGQKGDTGPAGQNAFTQTTAAFVMPSPTQTVVASVVSTSWMVVGQAVFVESAGYFNIDAVLSSTTVRLLDLDLHGNASAGLTIPALRKVSPGGYAYIDNTLYTNLDQRIDVLETAPGGNRTFYSATAPDLSTAKIGDIWFDTAHGYRIYRFDGSGWVDVQKVLDLEDFGLGIKPILKVDTLPLTGSIGDFVLLTTDNKLYRWNGTAWTAAVSTGDLVGQIPGALIVDGSVIAQKIAANAITADAIGTNQIIAHAANIGDGVITDAKIANLAAGKVTAGDLVAVNMSHTGRLFHPSYQGNKFRSREFATSFENSHAFGSGAGFTFSHGAPVTAYCPGNSGYGSGITIAPDSAGNVFVEIEGRLLGYTGNVCIYYRKNGGAYSPLAARACSDDGNAILSTMRQIGGVSATDYLEFYVAPCDGGGNATSGVNCRFELDVAVSNW